MNFDPNSTATADSGIFGLPFSPADAKLVLIPVPWDVTTSYGKGASKGPEAVLAASHQVDLFDFETRDVYRHGYALLEIPDEILSLNREFNEVSTRVVAQIEAGEAVDLKLVKRVNQASEQVNAWVYEQSKAALDRGQIVAVLGGDHSSPLGAIRALSEKYKGDFSILHVDAHADLRDAYQGFQHSHASIMHNVMESSFRPKKLVQVGIRDFSDGEFQYIQSKPSLISTHFDAPTKRRLMRGESWQKICDEVVAQLSERVYISFDIDGLTPDLCPSTGTPVPGGLSFEQATCLLATLHEHKKTIVGFDLCEVAQLDESSEWDGNVGARLLFKMCGWTMMTNGLGASK